MAQRIKVSDNFFLDEFICPSLYAERGAKAIALLDKRIIEAVELIRQKTGRPILVNNWWNGGNYKESGLRTFNTKTGAKLSQHKFGRALDIKVTGMTPKEVHAMILKHEQEFLSIGLTTMENVNFTPTWTHIDCRFTGQNSIQIVNP